MTMARGVAVVLFTDLVGSTELRGRLGDEAAERLRRTHDQLLAQAIEAHNGRVVKGLGDGVMAVFTGASDGVASAVAIQQAIDRLNRSGEAAEPVAVRVGLSAGDVSFEDDDIHGTPVIEASRLCAAARGGEILAGEVVRILAGSTGGHECVPVGPLELKGLDHPVAAMRVAWEPVAVSSIPMPALLTDIGRVFVGRDGELECLQRLWKEAAAGERRVALLAGEPGVGKTRLAAELAVEVHEEGAIVLGGRCDEDLGVPYQPFVEALRHFVDHGDPAALPGCLGRYGGELTRLVPELSDRAELPPPLRSDPDTERYRLFDAVAAWLAVVSAERPVLLVLDDLHWAAKPTLLLLRHVLRFADPLRLLIAGTYRDTELGRRHPLSEFLADLRRQSGVQRLPISGLDAADVTRFVEELAGHGLEGEEEDFARAIHAETEGNPFFVREVLRHLSETGAIERHEGRWVTTTAIDDLGIPEGIRDVVGRRLSRLSDEANEALAVAAVIGAEFESSVLAPAGGLAEDVVVAALDDAVTARLITESRGRAGHYRFAHALVRATLYDELSAARRVALHRRVAEGIEIVHTSRLDDHLPALAYHYGQAAVPAAEPAKALDYARRAGDAALAQLAHDDAVRYYRQTLDLLRLFEITADDPQRIPLLITLGEAERRAGIPAYRETLFEAARLARLHHDSDALARAALANSRGGLVSNAGRIDAERIELLRAALEAAGGGDSPARARLLAHLATELLWTEDWKEVAHLSDLSVGMARRLGIPAILADVLQSSFYPNGGPLGTALRFEYSTELLNLGDRLADPRVAFYAYWHRTRATMEMADVAEASRCVEHQKRLADDLGEPTLRWMSLIAGSGLPLVAGHPHQAEEQAVAAYTLAKGVEPDADTFYAAPLYFIRREQDRLDELLSIYEDLADDPTFRIPGMQAATAFIYSELGRLDESRAYYEPLAETGFRRLHPSDYTWFLAITACVEVCVRLGDSASAQVLHDQLALFSDRLATLGVWGLNSVSHYLGLLATTLGRFDEAENRFGASAAMHLRIGAPAWLARTRIEWARMLLTRRQPRDAEQAEDLLGQALAIARELALVRSERDAVALLQG